MDVIKGSHSDLTVIIRKVYKTKMSIAQFLDSEVSSIFSNPLLFSLLSFPLILFLTRCLFTSPRSKKHLPPSPPKLPFIGNLHQVGLFPHRTLQSLARKHGPVMLLHFGKVPTVVVSSADGAREIMKTQDLVFSDRPRSSLSERLLYDYRDVSAAPYGEYWRQMKSLYVLQLLSNKRVQSYSKIRLEETAIMVKKIRECSALRSPVNLSDLFESVTNNVISRAAFGKRYGEGERGEKFKQLLRELLELLSGPDIGELLPGCKWMSRINGYDAKMERVSKGLDEFLEGVVEGRMNSFSTESREAEEGDREDFLDILIRVYRDNKGGTSFDKDCIKALILTAFAGGTDTSATFLEWATTELLKHPRVLIKLQTEVRDVLKDRPEIMEDDLNKMHYLKAVIKEIFRLHPPIPLLVPRTAREDVRVMGYDLAAGTMVIINAWAIGRDPSLWDEAEEFRPERFLVSDIDFKGHDFQLIPFGAGRRGCPGISFAMVLNELVLANLVHKFDWELAGGVRAEDLDMTECPGATIHRKTPLVALATPYPC